MEFNIEKQETYSRSELLIRSFFGVFYIILPHGFLLLFVSLWGGILGFISFWSILFTGRYPESFFEFQVGLIRWNTRVNARLYNLCDGYPAFGIKAVDDKVTINIPYPENLSKSTLLLKAFFGFVYCVLPHGFILMFRSMWMSILLMIAFWVILFTGTFPAAWHQFAVDTLRWSTRVNLYMNFMSDEYPPFNGRP